MLRWTTALTQAMVLKIGRGWHTVQWKFVDARIIPEASVCTLGSRGEGYVSAGTMRR